MTESGIDGVIERLDVIIDQQRDAGSRLGYFPALYRRVTVAIRDGIESGVFEDPVRMDRFDVVFANRYIDALDGYSRGEPITQAWQNVFTADDDWWPIVLQHLLLAINAHINLDLGIAAAVTSPGDDIDKLQQDFDRVNDILESLVVDVERQLGEIWPALVWLGRLAGDKDDAIINFSIGKARRNAWRVAKQLAPLDESARSRMIRLVDQQTAAIGHLIRHPGPFVSCVTGYIRLRERGTTREIIDILRRKASF